MGFDLATKELDSSVILLKPPKVHLRNQLDDLFKSANVVDHDDVGELEVVSDVIVGVAAVVAEAEFVADTPNLWL